MQKFKLLIVGDANHQYIINFCKWLRTVKPNLSITIISFHPIKNKSKANEHFDNFFEVPPNSKIISKIKGFRTFYLAWKLYRVISKNNLQANTILIHYVIPQLVYVAYFLKKRTSNYTLALWGSDYYRATPKSYFKINLKYADNIIIGSPQMIDDFKSKYPMQMAKVHLCYFGNEPIENLKSFKETNVTNQNSRSYFNLSDDKINITIGHNGSKAHQHILILNELRQLRTDITQKIRVILPMTYGLGKNYLNEVKLIVESCSFECRIFTDFMDENEVAHLRNLTDVMLNLQTTDAFSGSMREVLYCGGLVINGSWLPYNFLKEMGIYFEEVNSVNEISNKLTSVINNFTELSDKCKTNAFIIYSISSWSQTIHKWKEVIELQR